MRVFKNGDACPCCGEPIEGRSEEWLELFSQTMFFMGLNEACNQEPDPVVVEAAVEDCTTCRHRALAACDEPCASCGGAMKHFDPMLPGEPDPVDAEAAAAIDRHEAEFGADGRRVFGPYGEAQP